MTLRHKPLVYKTIALLVLAAAIGVGSITSCGLPSSSSSSGGGTTLCCSESYPLCCGGGYCCPSGYGYLSRTSGKCYATSSACYSAGNCVECRLRGT